jgi:pyridinium-3,5-bisthiocarboxylic acid mononucleotide nickel chelatase
MFVEVPVAGGSVAIKVAHRDGVIVRVTPEFEDVAAAAVASSSAPSAVLQESIAAAWQAGLRPGAPIPAR